MHDPRLPVDRQGSIAIVSFDRPAALNAFDLAMWRNLAATMESLSAEEELRCVELRGAGTRAFSAGADIAAGVLIFLVGELLMSRLLFRRHLRDRPY